MADPNQWYAGTHAGQWTQRDEQRIADIERHLTYVPAGSAEHERLKAELWRADTAESSGRRYDGGL